MKKRNKTLLAIALWIGFVSIAASNMPHGLVINTSATDTPTYAIDVRDTSNTRTFSVTPNGVLTAVSANITTLTASIERTIQLPLVAAFIVGTGVMGNDGTTAPGMATVDGVMAIVYATSAETAHCQWEFVVPADYSSGMSADVMISSDNATGTKQNIDYALYINDGSSGGAVFGTIKNFAAVAGTSTVLDVSCETINLPFGTTGEAITAGDTITLDIFQSSGTGNVTTEIKSVRVKYTASQ